MTFSLPASGVAPSDAADAVGFAGLLCPLDDRFLPDDPRPGAVQQEVVRLERLRLRRITSSEESSVSENAS